MDFTFQAIGLEIDNEAAYEDLALDVGRLGEASELQRSEGTLHGRCLKLGKGLEVWAVLYEPHPGELHYADCRPAFRARRTHRIAPWILSEFTSEGAATVHGFVEDSETEVLFELQNLTEVGSGVYRRPGLTVGLCGLAYFAEVLETPVGRKWESLEKDADNSGTLENDWLVTGRIAALESIRNPRSGRDLLWLLVDAGVIELEVIVSQRALAGDPVEVGAFLRAEVWLQGHVALAEWPVRGLEGLDRSVGRAEHWSRLKRPN
jgi:hypothetical protein